MVKIAKETSKADNVKFEIIPIGQLEIAKERIGKKVVETENGNQRRTSRRKKVLCELEKEIKS